MKKKILLIFMCVLTVLCTCVLSGCGESKIEKKVVKDPEFTKSINTSLSQSGFSGDVTVNDDEIVMKIDAVEQLGTKKISDNVKEAVIANYKSNFSNSAPEIKRYLDRLEREVGQKNLHLTIKVFFGDEEVLSRDFK